jgi:hypothetical protein
LMYFPSAHILPSRLLAAVIFNLRFLSFGVYNCCELAL